jgi:hypothetical protein
MVPTITANRVFAALPSLLILLVGFAASFAATRVIATEDVPDWIRGRGDQLELRLTGQVTHGGGGPVDGARVRIEIKCNDQLFDSLEPPVDGGRFQVWLPVHKYPWYSIHVCATCLDGARDAQVIGHETLRGIVQSGLTLRVQRPGRRVSVRVEREGKPIASAHVRAELNNGALRSVTDASGIATLMMSPDEELQSLTAWSDEGLIGGHMFSRTPIRDPRADSHVISMYRCRPFNIHLEDETGKPVAGVDLGFHVATPEPDFNYLGTPDDCKPTTNQDGFATIRWYPDLKDAHCYTELLDRRWVIQSSQRDEDGVYVIARRAAERSNWTGHVVAPGMFTGGFNVLLKSFQGEEENRAEWLRKFSDIDGSFSAEVLPGSTYVVILEDDKWVANLRDLIPVDKKTGQQQPADLILSEGVPVRVSVTQGRESKPVLGAEVNLRSLHRLTWLEGGRPRSGTSGRDRAASTDRKGVVEMVAPEGPLEASAFLPDWRAEQSIDVRRGAINEIHLHRKVDQAVKVVGRVISWKDDPQQIANSLVHIKAIDGESNDEVREKTDEDGSFRINTKATRVGAIAYSPDKQFVGTAVIEDLSKPAGIQLYPAKSYAGQITDQDGRPIGDHKVVALICIEEKRESGTPHPTTFQLPRIETRTDPEGHYRIDGLPCLTRIYIEAVASNEEEGRSASVDEVYFLPDDDVRRRVTRIGAPASRMEPLPLTQRFASTHRDCRLGNYHLMMIVYDKSNASQVEFVNAHLLPSTASKSVASYMQLQADLGEVLAEMNTDFIERHNLSSAISGVFAITYDLEGKELGRIHIDPEAVDAAETACGFIERYAPAQQDAEAKWEEAFRQAKKQNKRVWVRTSQRYCGPCFMLSRWIDDHREVIEKDFVVLKIDDVRDLNGQAVAGRLTKGRFVGVPFHAMFDASETLIADSFGPLGNIGSMSGVEGKRHFKKMLDEACSKITSQEIQMLLDSLGD